MKKIYLIYAKIPWLLFDTKMSYLISSQHYKRSNAGYYIGLYAWTDDKILLDGFMEFRKQAKSMYKVIKEKIDDEEFNTFILENDKTELSYYQFPLTSDGDEFCYGIKPKDLSIISLNSFFHQKGQQPIICTKEEYVEAVGDGESHIIEYLMRIVTIDYIIFKDKYVQALDKLGYCTMFSKLCCNISDTEEENLYFERFEASQYNSSFNLSLYGNKFLDITKNSVAIFINLYYEMIVGYNDDGIIRYIEYN